MWNVCLCGAHLWDCPWLPQVNINSVPPISYSCARLPHNKTELLAMVGKKQARQFHQALYSINQKSSDLKKWEALKQTPKLGTAYKWDYWVIIDEEKTQICCPCTITSAHEIADCKIQGGEVHLQVRAPLRCQGWDPSVRREVHWFWHDQKYSGAGCVWKYHVVKFKCTWLSSSPLLVRCTRCTLLDSSSTSSTMLSPPTGDSRWHSNTYYCHDKRTTNYTKFSRAWKADQLGEQSSRRRTTPGSTSLLERY